MLYYLNSLKLVSIQSFTSLTYRRFLLLNWLTYLYLKVLKCIQARNRPFLTRKRLIFRPHLYQLWCKCRILQYWCKCKSLQYWCKCRFLHYWQNEWWICKYDIENVVRSCVFFYDIISCSYDTVASFPIFDLQFCLNTAVEIQAFFLVWYTKRHWISLDCTIHRALYSEIPSLSLVESILLLAEYLCFKDIHGKSVRDS